VKYSACVDVAIFVLANQIVWRLFYQVRLLLLPPGRSRFGLAVERWLEQDVFVSLENDKSGVAGFGR